MLPDFAVDNGVIVLFHSRNAHFQLAVTNPSICQLPPEMMAPVHKYPAVCCSPVMKTTAMILPMLPINLIYPKNPRPLWATAVFAETSMCGLGCFQTSVCPEDSDVSLESPSK